MFMYVVELNYKLLIVYLSSITYYYVHDYL